jgi:O-antigen ligase
MVKFALRREFVVIRALFFIAPLLTLLAPRTTVPVLIVLSIACVITALVQGQSPKQLFRLDLGLTLFAVLTAYLFMNATWSLDPSRAFGKAAWFGLIVLMTFGASRALSTWQKPQIRAALAAFLAGLAVGIAFVLFELATSHYLVRLMFNTLPITRPDGLKGLVVQDGMVLRIAIFELNRHVAVMLLMLWPALACLGRLGDKRWGLIAIIVLCLAVIASVGLSHHETSKLGLVLSAIVFVIARPWPTATRRALWIGWCLAFILVVPFATIALKAQLHQAEWLPFSAKARVILWAYTAEQVPKAPLLGIGLTSTRKSQQNLKAPEKPEGYVYAWRAGWHAHNAFLQAWYELGAFGVILLIAAGASMIGYIGRLSTPMQPFILAQLTAFLTIFGFSWGMWQSWLMAVAGLAAMYAALAVSFCRAEEPAP